MVCITGTSGAQHSLTFAIIRSGVLGSALRQTASGASQRSHGRLVSVDIGVHADQVILMMDGCPPAQSRGRPEWTGTIFWRKTGLSTGPKTREGLARIRLRRRRTRRPIMSWGVVRRRSMSGNSRSQTQDPAPVFALRSTRFTDCETARLSCALRDRGRGVDRESSGRRVLWVVSQFD